MPEQGLDFYFDTVTLSNFALVHRLDLLITRYGRRVCITPEVLDEISEGIVAGYLPLGEVEAAVASDLLRAIGPLSFAERRAYRSLLNALGPGEASCVTYAEARGGVVVTDDRAARQHCAEKGLVVTGTIGILKACCRTGTLEPSEADAVLQAMMVAGYHSPVRRIRDLL